jgi:hypothetical protein
VLQLWKSEVRLLERISRKSKSEPKKSKSEYLLSRATFVLFALSVGEEWTVGLLSRGLLWESAINLFLPLTMGKGVEEDKPI